MPPSMSASLPVPSDNMANQANLLDALQARGAVEPVAPSRSETIFRPVAQRPAGAFQPPQPLALDPLRALQGVMPPPACSADSVASTSSLPFLPFLPYQQHAYMPLAHPLFNSYGANLQMLPSQPALWQHPLMHMPGVGGMPAALQQQLSAASAASSLSLALQLQAPHLLPLGMQLPFGGMLPLGAMPPPCMPPGQQQQAVAQLGQLPPLLQLALCQAGPTPPTALQQQGSMDLGASLSLSPPSSSAYPSAAAPAASAPVASTSALLSATLPALPALSLPTLPLQTEEDSPRARASSGAGATVAAAAEGEQQQQQQQQPTRMAVDDAYEKVMKRKQANRDSARRSRIRREAQVSEICMDVEHMESRNRQLEAQLQALAAAADSLEAHNALLQRGIDAMAGTGAAAPTTPPRELRAAEEAAASRCAAALQRVEEEGDCEGEGAAQATGRCGTATGRSSGASRGSGAGSSGPSPSATHGGRSSAGGGGGGMSGTPSVAARHCADEAEEETEDGAVNRSNDA